MKVNGQLRCLKRWEFDFRQDTNDYVLEIENVIICWSVKNQMGAYVIDGMLSLIFNWEMLDDLMSEFVIY